MNRIKQIEWNIMEQGKEGKVREGKIREGKE